MLIRHWRTLVQKGQQLRNLTKHPLRRNLHLDVRENRATLRAEPSNTLHFAAGESLRLDAFLLQLGINGERLLYSYLNREPRSFTIS